MAFTTNLSGTAQVDDSIKLEFDAQFIIASGQEQVMDQFVSYKKQIGAKSIDFEKFSQLALATTPLVEVDDVVSEAMVDANILLTPAEYGNVVTTTKLANLQTGGQADLAAARLVGLNMGRTIDKLAILAGEGSANELTPTAGAESTLVAGDVMTVSFLNSLYNKLARQSVQPLSDGMYVAVMHDDIIHDLRNSSGAGSWQDIKKYTDPSEILKNEVGQIAGFKIVRDNHVSVNADAGAALVDTYHTICMGFNALGKAVSNEPGMVASGPFDKLGRFVNLGWYGALQYGIIDQDALFLGTTSSSIGVNV
jgi:N4-gp56 family major capsid protein